MNSLDRNPLREGPGKGDSARNNFSEKFRKNFDEIDWKKKDEKPKETTDTQGSEAH